MRNYRRAFAPLVGAVILAATSFTIHIQAFDLPQHRMVTDFVLKQIRVPIAGKDRAFSKGAIDQIIYWNERTDDKSTFSAAWFAPERHFTDEAYVASTQN